MTAKKRKNMSFRLKVEVVDMLNDLQKSYEDKLNERVPLNLELSKTKIVEILIQSAWEELKESDTDSEKNSEKS